MATPLPLTPGPLSHRASLGRGGASGVPVAYPTNHTLNAPPSSPLPASGRGVAKPGRGELRALSNRILHRTRDKARAAAALSYPHPLPPPPPRRLGERGSLSLLRGSRYTATPHTLLPPPLSPQVGEGWRSRGEGNYCQSCVVRHGLRQPAAQVPSPPAPSPTAQAWGEGKPRHVTQSSPLPAERRAPTKPARLVGCVRHGHTPPPAGCHAANAEP